MEHNGRLRKFYRITQIGREQIQEFLQGWKEIAAMYEFIREGVSHDEA